jgi:uncharacterized protein YggE
MMISTPLFLFLIAALIAFGVYLSNSNNVVAQSISELSSSTSNLSELNSNTTNTTGTTRTLSVTGTATTNLKPDKIILNLGVQTTNKTANEALTANSNIMNKVIDTLKA